MTIVDLVLHAASVCRDCRSIGRPEDTSDQEHGDSFMHPVAVGERLAHNQKRPCDASQLWVLIRKLEAKWLSGALR